MKIKSQSQMVIRSSENLRLAINGAPFPARKRRTSSLQDTA
jgi:hypothetical protein